MSPCGRASHRSCCLVLAYNKNRSERGERDNRVCAQEECNCDLVARADSQRTVERDPFRLSDCLHPRRACGLLLHWKQMVVYQHVGLELVARTRREMNKLSLLFRIF
jgi:hypothetical protein